MGCPPRRLLHHARDRCVQSASCADGLCSPCVTVNRIRRAHRTSDVSGWRQSDWHGGVGNGIATLSLKALAVGVHTITAVYGGDSNWSSSQASTMVTISQAQTTSTVSLLAGYKVLAVVTPVAPATGTPTGSVALLDPRPTVAPLFKGTLVDGSVSFTWPYTSVITNGLLRSPSTAVTVAYSGDANYKASNSAPLLHVSSAAANLGVSFAPDEVVSLFNVTGITGDMSATPAAAYVARKCDCQN